jgi:YidC/Oxa1 family membrane protein insertase
MDKKTITGLVLIGLILTIFSIVNAPTEEERKKELEKSKKELAEKKEDKSSKEKIEDEKTQEVKTNPSNFKTVKGELIRLENEKLIVDFSTKGGSVAAVYLKEYESYSDYDKKDSVITPLCLFKEGDASNGLVFPYKGKTINTAFLEFKTVNQKDNSITFEFSPADGQMIAYTYKLKKDAYDLDYSIHIEGLDKDVTPQNVMFKWKTAFRKTERLYSEQRRVTQICYNYPTNGFDYSSEMSGDIDEATDEVDWVAYKQSYFSSILNPANGFGKEGTKFTTHVYSEGDKKAWTNLKGFTSNLNLKLNSTKDATIEMNWFFGPNDYETLKSYGEGYDDILNFGWGIFRWINLYAVQPIFNWFVNTGMGLGIAILLLTLVLKLILMPIQWKMFVSSAKMKILKPEIDELNKKFPNKEDAMKKQVEMMSLYKESGASPLAGCIPMMIQMPILLAVFRFFPSAFELRQKSFLWADDLSSYDSILDLGMNIWPYGDHVSLFTLLMAATTLIYTHLNSGNMQQPQQPGMPNMKVIMYIFPIMMIFMFNNYSSGLSYYYFISTLISILMMLAIKHFFVDEEKLKEKMAARKLSKQTTVKKKSKFQERLEAMQKLQQEQKNNRRK